MAARMPPRAVGAKLRFGFFHKGLLCSQGPPFSGDRWRGNTFLVNEWGEKRRGRAPLTRRAEPRPRAPRAHLRPPLRLALLSGARPRRPGAAAPPPRRGPSARGGQADPSPGANRLSSLPPRPGARPPAPGTAATSESASLCALRQPRLRAAAQVARGARRAPGHPGGSEELLRVLPRTPPQPGTAPSASHSQRHLSFLGDSCPVPASRRGSPRCLQYRPPLAVHASRSALRPGGTGAPFRAVRPCGLSRRGDGGPADGAG